ncbi:hypothetical protein EL22_25245 [Halostagnicola sp. A56]|uniref:hypothetical protein n=1 Tax=Halostagnicola sp. A56 TaxID=1495067 RepID=UPI00049F3913|nr:hypothetical protein [Halostagnicola sp. A56]KDE56678.1 hypothetical protein EL22_25245 [Halostagnicola sp. A56]
MTANPMNETVGPDIPIERFGEGPGAWMEIIIDVWGSFAGEALVGLLIGTALMIGMYIQSGDMALPTVVLILLSSVLFGVLPGDYQQTAIGIMVIGITAAIFEVFRRYVW